MDLWLLSRDFPKVPILPQSCYNPLGTFLSFSPGLKKNTFLQPPGLFFQDCKSWNQEASSTAHRCNSYRTTENCWQESTRIFLPPARRRDDGYVASSFLNLQLNQNHTSHKTVWTSLQKVVTPMLKSTRLTDMNFEIVELECCRFSLRVWLFLSL